MLPLFDPRDKSPKRSCDNAGVPGNDIDNTKRCMITDIPENGNDSDNDKHIMITGIAGNAKHSMIAGVPGIDRLMTLRYVCMPMLNMRSILSKDREPSLELDTHADTCAL